MFTDNVEKKAKQLAALPKEQAREEFGRLVDLTFAQTGEKFVYGLSCNAHLVGKLREMGEFNRIWEVP